MILRHTAVVVTRRGVTAQLLVTMGDEVLLDGGGGAVRGRGDARMSTHLTVGPQRYVTQLALDKPLYQPGETILYRSLTLSRFGLAAQRELPIELKILDPGGSIVAGSQQQGYTERGVASGALAIPAGLPGGKYTLVARSVDPVVPLAGDAAVEVVKTR